MKVRDITQEWIDEQHRDATEIVAVWEALSKERHLQMLDALAVAVESLRKHEGECEFCGGRKGRRPHTRLAGAMYGGPGPTSWIPQKIVRRGNAALALDGFRCPHCGGTGSNAARRALDTTINGGES